MFISQIFRIAVKWDERPETGQVGRQRVNKQIPLYRGMNIFIEYALQGVIAHIHERDIKRVIK